MPSIETYRKHAKQLVRWHRDRNPSVGEKVRLLERYRELTDAAILTMPMPLTLAQEIVAVEAGFVDWSHLRLSADVEPGVVTAHPQRPSLTGVVPILFVRDVQAAASWYHRLGFITDFLHGNPPFYGSVSRDQVCLHLRRVRTPNFAELARRETSLILVSIEVDDVKAIFDQLDETEVEVVQRLKRQAWGGLDFHVRDPDGNQISFVEYPEAAAPAR
jgi:uncharacterized glyoxalase superfamily protein PhnB